MSSFLVCYAYKWKVHLLSSKGFTAMCGVKPARQRMKEETGSLATLATAEKTVPSRGGQLGRKEWFLHELLTKRGHEHPFKNINNADNHCQVSTEI